MRPPEARGTVDTLSIEVPSWFVDAVAKRAAEIVLDQLARQHQRPKYLTVAEAAELMRSKPQRIYDLLSSGRLTRFDGRRVLVRRAEVEIYLTAGAPSPVAPGLPPALRSRADLGNGR